VLSGLGLPALLPGLFLVAAVAGITSPNATAMSMERHGDRAGSASALLGVMQFTAGAIVPPLVSGAVGATAVSMTATMVAGFTAALAVLVVTVSRRAGAETERQPLVLDPSSDDPAVRTG
jgi:DHA1 family bicyclomycin/chloramphenicol resistance-like MFS transporter